MQQPVCGSQGTSLPERFHFATRPTLPIVYERQERGVKPWRCHPDKCSFQPASRLLVWIGRPTANR